MVAGEIPADVVLDTDRVLAFRDINPQAPTHVLVIPKDHHPTAAALAAADPGLLGEVVAGAQAVALQEGLVTDGGTEPGYRLVTNTGPQAGQSVHEGHFHLLGGRRMEWPPGCRHDAAPPAGRTASAESAQRRSQIRATRRTPPMASGSWISRNAAATTRFVEVGENGRSTVPAITEPSAHQPSTPARQRPKASRGRPSRSSGSRPKQSCCNGEPSTFSEMVTAWSTGRVRASSMCIQSLNSAPEVPSRASPLSTAPIRAGSHPRRPRTSSGSASAPTPRSRLP